MAKAVDRVLLRKRIRRMCKLAGIEGRELSLSLVGDAEMKALNRSYRNIERTTDVLAFAFDEERGGLESDLLGDVIVSIETAGRQALSRKVTLQKEVEDLFLHGILHLLGYDHTRSPREALAMRRKEMEIRLALDQWA